MMKWVKEAGFGIFMKFKIAVTGAAGLGAREGRRALLPPAGGEKGTVTLIHNARHSSWVGTLN